MYVCLKQGEYCTKKSTNCFSDSRDNMDGHKCRVFALQYHPTIPHVFLSGGWDNTVQVRHSF